jgi:hypothetical protein
MDRNILILQHIYGANSNIEVIRKLEISMALTRSDFYREYSSFVPPLHLTISAEINTRKVLHRTVLIF